MHSKTGRAGYTRISTVAQTLDQQNEALTAANVTKTFSDTMSGARDDRPTTAMIEENRRLVAENRELRRVNEVLRAASAYFASEIDPTRRRS